MGFLDGKVAVITSAGSGTGKASVSRAERDTAAEGLPHEVAEVGAFLASDRASFVTGTVVPFDGGWSATLA